MKSIDSNYFFNDEAKNKMPKRLSESFVRKQFEAYGYMLPPNWKYTNNKEKYDIIDMRDGEKMYFSYQRLKQNINRGLVKKYKPKTAFDKWRKKHLNRQEPDFPDDGEYEIQAYSNPEFNDLSLDQQRKQYDIYRTMRKNFNDHYPFTINLEDESTRYLKLAAFFEAAISKLPSLKNYQVRLKMYYRELAKPDYRYLNENTINNLDKFFIHTEVGRVKVSEDDLLKIYDLYMIKVDFVPVGQGKRKNHGFFPFLNISDIDLERYGIYKSLSHPDINESCLYHAFKVSGLLSDIEFDILKSSITTRLVPQTQLKEVSDFFKICISCKMVYEETDKTSTSIYGEEYKSNRSIKLLAYYNHYMINDKVDASAFYIKNYEKINLDQRFVNHQRKKMLKKANDKRYEFCKEGKGIRSIIKLMVEQKLLVPMNDDQLCSLRWSFKRSKSMLEGMARPISVKDKKVKNNYYANKIKQTTSLAINQMKMRSQID